MESTNTIGQQLMNIPATDYPLDIDWHCMQIEETFEKILEVPPVRSFFEWDSLALTCQKNYGFGGFEDLNITNNSNINGNFVSWDEYIVADINPVSSNVVDVKIESSTEVTDDKMTVESDIFATNSSKRNVIRRGRKKETVPLEFEEIKKYFDVPITEAAKQMKVGLTVLKKRCRELNIMRWPHRKIRSLKYLINNVKELGLVNEIVMLEEHTRLVEKVPNTVLTERTMRLRQVCFKANYKKKRCLAICN